MPQATKQARIEEAQGKIQQRQGLMNAAGTNHAKYQDALERRDAWVDTLRIYGGEVPDEFGAVPGSGGHDIPPATNTDAAERVKGKKRPKRKGKSNQHTQNVGKDSAANSASSSTKMPKNLDGATTKANKSIPDADDAVKKANPFNNTQLSAVEDTSTQLGTVESKDIPKSIFPKEASSKVNRSLPCVADGAKLEVTYLNDGTSQNIKAVQPKVESFAASFGKKVEAFLMEQLVHPTLRF